ncbi:MFS transporter [Cytobacillus sp. FJAT-54145]|uniref:MFS transporter n=1 Tax=Cytobacillus spartinae TaxID=3299023 RepID=A0ABW6K8V0_9BACI
MEVVPIPTLSIPTSSIKEEPIQERKILLLWSFTVWLVVMNTTMFNVALPTILAELSLTSVTASWIVSGYSIVFAISTLAFSRLSDYIPIARLLLTGLMILGIASIVGFFSNSFYLLLSARILQAVGAGAVPGLAMVLAGRYIPLSRRGKAMALIASAASLGFGIGPVIGGAITQYLGWNYLFTVTGFVLFSTPFFKKLLPQEEIKNINFDLLGLILTACSVTSLLLFLSTFSFTMLFSSVLIIAVTWLHIHKREQPFLQPQLLKNSQYIKLLFIGMTAFITHFSALFLMPIILTDVYQKEPAEVGLIIFPGAILSAITAPYIGSQIDRLGNGRVIITAQLFLFISTLAFAFLSTLSTYFILFTYMFMSIGFSALTSSISNEVTRILPKDDIGSGMGMAQLTQFFGGAFGVTITGLGLNIQEGLTLPIVYKNIYFGLTLLIGLTIFVFYFYYRKTVRINKNSDAF